ncbi:HK97 gp10 family phage protein [Acinetobacter sp. SwsAc6]|uniref:HK97-gp10 family putative phage morphogenesis protein n=1 Tax=Acinetobacter sp. SwsAc6 TaxID=2749439 RepID=UPI0015B84274|nr:HK97-gp10 family putative phage morphogenesis protein [Acinetobacter sp. SwsAc6]NWK74157.1 HK97 gp10 family phage protein [Acinetobacter sp. SwsAc6]
MSLSVEIEGMDEIQQKIKRLGNQKFTRNAATRAARKAMRIVRDAARNGAKSIDNPETSERIWKNISIASSKSKDKSVVRMRVGVRGGAAVNAKSNRAKLAALPGGETVHWRHIELGNSHHAAQPFMRPALANNIQQVTNSFSKNFSEELDKELAKR